MELPYNGPAGMDVIEESPSIESKLEVMAQAWDHFRILRDSAARAEDYLGRVVKNGEISLEDFWIDFPEPISSLSLKELLTGVAVLSNDLSLRLTEIEEKTAKILTDLKINKKPTAILYSLVEKQRNEQKDFEEKWMNRDSEDEVSMLDTMPHLGPDDQAEWNGHDWELLDNPNKKKKSSKPQPKPIFSLKTRPKK